MELQFRKSTIPYLNQVLREVQNQEQTQEIRLTDGMPDIGKILCAWGQVVVRSKEWRNDSTSFSGGVMVWVLYAPEDGTQPRTLESWIPFQMKWDLPRDSRDGTLRIKPLLRFVDAFCGKRVAWAWYAAVSILSLLLSPDKEAAAVFLFLGYYPIIKAKLDQTRAKWLWKLLFFNGASVTLYWILLNVIGMAELVQEMDEMGVALLWVLLALGNLTFFMVDRLLTILESRLLRRAR